MARLKVRRHQQEFGELVLDENKKHYLGRKENSDVVLQSDPGISRQHMELSYENGVWIAKILSQHLPIIFEGKTLIQLELKSSPMHFQVQPYDFVFETEGLPEKESIDNLGEIPLLLDNDISSNSGAESSGDSYSDFNQAIPMGHEIEKNEDSSDAINPEVSFHGSEEKTSEISLTGEPYLKFMYSTHSESIRLKGNKWIAGRDNIVQIHLDDRKASRQHFSIEKAGEQFYIKDLNSANGTLLNGQELIAEDAKELKSGDIVTVNQLTIIFELRDLSFSDKLKDLPLQAYSGPMILTSQEWDAVGPNLAPTLPAPMPLSTPQLAQIGGSVQRIQHQAPKKNPLRAVLMGAVAIMVIVGAYYANQEPPKPQVSEEQIKTFESLKPEDQKLVIDDYNLVQQYSANGQIENALSRLAKIHSIVPFFKESKEIEARMREAREIIKQQEFIKQQQREQEETKARVVSIVSDCRDRYASGVDVNAARSCLTEALQLDPDNIDAQSIIAGIEMRLSQAQEQERQLKEYNDSVDKGRNLYTKAKTLLQNKDYHEAINAFSAHMNSNLPDPDRLKTSSERTIASIQNHINQQKNRYMDKARSLQSTGNIRDAILHAEQAKKIDPYDYSIPNFIESNRRELEGQMKLLYTESAIEEKFGNLTISKEKWIIIINKDIPTGEYYLKAKRKMQQYGLL
ncbi:MAG: FHA domain-containing protein [Bdellovibrionaceae bacterium]|nr:FHA domain-containing protein [Pseudobdellovibrionaceae bacterium]